MSRQIDVYRYLPDQQRDRHVPDVFAGAESEIAPGPIRGRVPSAKPMLLTPLILTYFWCIGIEREMQVIDFQC